MPHASAFPASDFLAFQLIDPRPEPIRTGYIRRMLNRGGGACGGLLVNDELAAPFLRKLAKEITELLQAYALPPEDPARRLKMASEVSDIRDVFPVLRNRLPADKPATRKGSPTLGQVLQEIEDLEGFLQNDNLTSTDIVAIARIVGGASHAVNAFTRQPDVALTLAELNTAAAKRTVGVDDFEGYYVTHFIVPRTATAVIAAHGPDKWQEVAIEACPPETMLTHDILNAGHHGNLRSQREIARENLERLKASGQKPQPKPEIRQPRLSPKDPLQKYLY